MPSTKYARTQGPKLNTENRQLLKTILEAIDNKKGIDVKTLHVGELVSYTDYLVLCTGASDPQVKALADFVEEKVKLQNSVRPLLSYKDPNWLILDYIDIVVHIFRPETRAYYDLDTLWEDAPRVEIRI